MPVPLISNPQPVAVDVAWTIPQVLASPWSEAGTIQGVQLLIALEGPVVH